VVDIHAAVVVLVALPEDGGVLVVLMPKRSPYSLYISLFDSFFLFFLFSFIFSFFLFSSSVKGSAARAGGCAVAAGL
jgi:hypothetical protein